MSPESRTLSFKRAGKLASLALLMAAGLVTPAAAADGDGNAQTTTANTAAADRPCEHRPGFPNECPTTPPTLPTPGCTGLDSVTVGTTTRYISVICNGRVYVLTVDESANPPAAVGGWKAVGGATNTALAKLALVGSNLVVTEFTSTGQLSEGVCPTPLAATNPCTFTTLPTPPGP